MASYTVGFANRSALLSAVSVYVLIYLHYMAHTFTSIGHVVERLQECEHFLGRLNGSNGLHFKFELNAFLSASRSVTFVLQKTLAHVPQFEGWYRCRQDESGRSDAILLGTPQHLSKAGADIVHRRIYFDGRLVISLC
jgi:hypothetical protein